MECDLQTMSIRCPIAGNRFRFTNNKRRYISVLTSSKLHQPSCSTNLSISHSKKTLPAIKDDVPSFNESLDTKVVLIRYSEALKDCAMGAMLRQGTSLHGSFLKCGVLPDTHFWVSLINFYSKCGQLASARKVLDQMPQRDVVSWTALISGFLTQGLELEAVRVYSQMRIDDVMPNEFTVATALKACSRCFNLGLIKQLQAEAIKADVVHDSFVGSALVDAYGKSGDLISANRAFSLMPEVNEVSWNALLNSYVQEGNVKIALKLFSTMKKNATKLNIYTISAMLKVCSNSGRFKEGKAMHCAAIRNGCDPDVYLSSSLVDLYCKCGSTGSALAVFERMRAPDTVSFTAMIAGLEQSGKGVEASEIFARMRRNGFDPNQFTISSLVSAATSMEDLPYGESVHACGLKLGFESDTVVANSLIMMYSRAGDFEGACRVFDETSARDLISWNSLLTSSEASPKLFCKMLDDDVQPNKYTFISVLRGSTRSLNVDLGKQLHSMVIKSCLACDAFVGTALLDMYATNGLMLEAEEVFNRLSPRDVFPWTVMISGYSRTEETEKSLELYKQMRREGVDPNEFTLASCLTACSRRATAETGKQFHSLAIKSANSLDPYIGTALVDMYEKSGLINEAEAIFEDLRFRDTISWNAMITGYSRHGKAEEAIECFRRMKMEGYAPDEATFVGVLSACSHMGMVEEAKSYFASITVDHSLRHSIEHIVCMIDALARAGRFDEVESWIEKWRLEESAMVWEAVLGGCGAHGNVEMGERAARKLMEMKPDMDSAYVLLANIYAGKGRWNEVRRVRDMMARAGVKKEPGCSWVEVDGEVHVFLSGDSVHLKEDDSYGVIGCVPNTRRVVHRLDDVVDTVYLG